MSYPRLDISMVAEELRAPLRKLPRMPFANTWGGALIRTVLRFMPSAKVHGVKIEQRNDLNPPLRIYIPDVCQSDGALYWIHGGGYVIGRAAVDDSLCGAPPYLFFWNTNSPHRLVDLHQLTSVRRLIRGRRYGTIFPFP